MGGVLAEARAVGELICTGGAEDEGEGESKGDEGAIGRSNPGDDGKVEIGIGEGGV